jgi:hypothetical protein
MGRMRSFIVGDEVEYLYKGKSYCDDCYKAVKKLEAIQQEKGTKSFLVWKGN